VAGAPVSISISSSLARPGKAYALVLGCPHHFVHEKGETMTRGIFDPNSDNVQRGPGNNYAGEPAIGQSQMPDALVDGEVEEDPDAQADVIDDEIQPPFTDNPDAAADNLTHIEVEDEGQVDLDEEEVVEEEESH
jgi:hypothetical protein